MKTPVFILSTNRCGSNWLANTLEKHPQITATIECDPVMSFVCTAALFPDQEEFYLPQIFQFYDEQIEKDDTPVYVDKSHFNLFLVDHIAERYPQARFLIIDRNPLQVIASMMNHTGTLQLFALAQSFNFPNRVLANIYYDDYKDLSYLEKAYFMYRQYKKKIREFRYRKNTLIIYYDALVTCFEDYMKLIFQFLDIDNIQLPNDANIKSCTRYMESLTDDQRGSILRLISGGVK